MNNVVFIRFSWTSKTYYAWMERTDGTKRTIIESVESKPWNGSNRPESTGYSASSISHTLQKPFKTDRERVKENQPTKSQAQAMGTKKKGKQ